MSNLFCFGACQAYLKKNRIRGKTLLKCALIEVNTITIRKVYRLPVLQKGGGKPFDWKKFDFICTVHYGMYKGYK